MGNLWESRTCRACEGGVKPLEQNVIERELQAFPGWAYQDGKLTKTFTFKNYYETTAFVNAVVWIAHKENHHPDVEFGYNTCRIGYATHSIKGISENDFICIAKIEQFIT